MTTKKLRECEAQMDKIKRGTITFSVITGFDIHNMSRSVVETQQLELQSKSPVTTAMEK
jgi:hypothetical protein